MRKFIDFLIDIYLWPIRINHKLLLYVKGKIATSDEHFLITLDVIQRKFPKDDGIVVDIGAYDADSTIYLAKRLPRNKILGFEPNPEPFKRGVSNASGYKNVELFPIGFSDKKGEVNFYLTTNAVSSSIYGVKENPEISLDKVISVQVTTLDDFFSGYQSVLLMKLDVQGAEINVLRGGVETLKKTKLVLTEVLNSEFYEGGGMYYEVDQLLRQNNFRTYSIIANYNNEGIKYFDVLYYNLNIA